MNDSPVFKELKDGLLEYCGPTDDSSLAVEKWRELDASIDIGIWGQASIAAAIVPTYGQQQIDEFAGAVEKHPSYVRRMAKTYRYFIIENKTRVSNLSFKHHCIALRHPYPLEALETASLNGWGCAKLEEWILNEAQANSGVKKAISHLRQSDYREFLERVDSIIFNDFMQTCPNAKWGQRVFKNWRDEIAWELRQVDHEDTAEMITAAMDEGAHTVADIKAATGLAARDIEGVIGIKVAEGAWEWVREGGETDMARGSRRAILHRVGTPVFT